MAITRFDPFRDLAVLQDRMNRMFNDSFVNRGGDEALLNRGTWTPAVDIYEVDGALVLKAELPEMRREDIEVTVENNTLTIRGERKLDNEINPQPALVESHEVSEDGLQFRLTVRQGVTYHSGNPMTVDDVVANLERARDPETAGNLLQTMEAVTDIHAVDDSTIEINFSEPAAYFVTALGLQPTPTPAIASGPAFERMPHLVYFLHDELIVHTPAELADEVAVAVHDAAVEAGRMLFGHAPVEFPLDLVTTRSYASTG